MPEFPILQQRTILVTGASQGIGACAAKTFAALGAEVILLGRSVKKLEAVYDDIIAENHPEPAIYPLDLAKAHPEDYQQLAELLSKEYGKLDGLLHNAGQLQSLTPIAHYPIDQWHQVMQVNVNAAFMLTQATLPLLLASDDASIVFTTSNVGYHGKAYWGAYCASKYAVNGLMETLAQELEANTTVRVNCINPGRVRTKMRAKAYPAENASQHPLPRDIMAQYIYLLGPESRGITGQHILAQPTTESAEPTENATSLSGDTV